jgi:hypothetical protein
LLLFRKTRRRIKERGEGEEVGKEMREKWRKWMTLTEGGNGWISLTLPAILPTRK